MKKHVITDIVNSIIAWEQKISISRRLWLSLNEIKSVADRSYKLRRFVVDGVQMRKCTKCYNVLPETEKIFRRRTRGDFNWYCKACERTLEKVVRRDYTKEQFNYKQNHATLVHALKVIDNLCETDKSFNLFIDKLRSEIIEIYGCNLVVEECDLLKSAINNTYEIKEELFKKTYKNGR